MSRRTEDIFAAGYVLYRSGTQLDAYDSASHNFVDIMAKRVGLLLLTVLCWRAGAQNLRQSYANYGELLLTQLVSAPFPHPNRVAGHNYRSTADDGTRRDEFYSAKDHYSDSTVAIFIPKGVRPTERIDFVVHFHGWRNHVGKVLSEYRLLEQLVASQRNAILVVPQGPYDAPDSFGGKLEDRDGFKRFMDEVMAALKSTSALTNVHSELGDVILSGHSGGYQVISSILDRGGLSAQVKEVWLFDALYAQTDKFLAWLDRTHGRFLDIYTLHGGTKTETESLMQQLKTGGIAYFAGKESDVTAEQLRPARPCFMFSELPHNDVVAAHETFRKFLETSCLQKR